MYNRVQHKLTGRDFNPDQVLSVADQVDKLIIQATSLENLCQCFSGWCVFSRYFITSDFLMLIDGYVGVHSGDLDKNTICLLAYVFSIVALYNHTHCIV